MPGKSTSDLQEFLDFTSSKGSIKQSIIRDLKTACNAVFGILGEDEAKDVFSIDWEEAFQRYDNLNALSVSPNTLRTYRQRVSQAVSEFERFHANPSQWKPTIGRRSGNAAKRSTKNQKDVMSEAQNDSDTLQTGSADDIVHRFPLRRNTIVQISGLPYDVTRTEMTRMANFLQTLVAETEPGGSPQLMLTSPDVADQPQQML